MSGITSRYSSVLNLIMAFIVFAALIHLSLDHQFCGIRVCDEGRICSSSSVREASSHEQAPQDTDSEHSCLCISCQITYATPSAVSAPHVVDSRSFCHKEESTLIFTLHSNIFHPPRLQSYLS